MRVNKAAERPGEQLAPSWFRDHLKEHMGEKFDCWYHPGLTRIEKDVDGSELKLSGAWVVWQRIRMIEFVDDVGVARDAWVNVYALDGEFDLPTELGHWVVNVLKHADVTVRGNEARARAVNDYNEKQRMNAYHASVTRAEDASKDKLMRKQFQKHYDAQGAKPMLRQEIIQQGKDIERQEIAMYNKARREALGSRFQVET